MVKSDHPSGSEVVAAGQARHDEPDQTAYGFLFSDALVGIDAYPNHHLVSLRSRGGMSDNLGDVA
jgi:hypothetical protein